MRAFLECFELTLVGGRPYVADPRFQSHLNLEGEIAIFHMTWPRGNEVYQTTSKFTIVALTKWL